VRCTHGRTSKIIPHALPHAHRTCGVAIIRTCAPQPNVCVYLMFLSVHSGLRLNLNLCLFLQTFNAISESEYVKIGSMCIFFLISMICLSENALLYIFRVKLKSCSISIRQRLLFTNFPRIFCSQLIKCLCGSVVEL
jgi:hypothetical protein